MGISRQRYDFGFPRNITTDQEVQQYLDKHKQREAYECMWDEVENSWIANKIDGTEHIIWGPNQTSKIKVSVKNYSSDKIDNDQIGGDHYKSHKITPWDVIDDWNLDKKHYRADALTYVIRAGSKVEPGLTPEEQEIKDIEKAIHYLRKHLSREFGIKTEYRRV